jgi:hypothetical protein
MAQTALARADLEALLKARKLDRTLQPAGDRAAVNQPAVPPELVWSTGLTALDARLGGGLLRGQMSEIVGPRSSGRITLMCAALAAATGRGELAALVDPLDGFDPVSAASCGVALDRLLWVRGEGMTASPLPIQARGQADRLMDRAVKALNLVLQAGGFDLVVLDCAEMPPDAIRRLPFTTWFRLQRAIEGSRTVCLLAGPAPISRSASGVSLQLTTTRAGLWTPPLFRGLDIQARIVCARDAADGRCRVEARA